MGRVLFADPRSEYKWWRCGASWANITLGEVYMDSASIILRAVLPFKRKRKLAKETERRRVETRGDLGVA